MSRYAATPTAELRRMYSSLRDSLLARPDESRLPELREMRDEIDRRESIPPVDVDFEREYLHD